MRFTKFRGMTEYHIHIIHTPILEFGKLRSLTKLKPNATIEYLYQQSAKHLYYNGEIFHNFQII